MAVDEEHLNIGIQIDQEQHRSNGGTSNEYWNHQRNQTSHVVSMGTRNIRFCSINFSCFLCFLSFDVFNHSMLSVHPSLITPPFSA